MSISLGFKGKKLRSFGFKVKEIMNEKNIKPPVLARRVNISDLMLERMLKDYIKPKRVHLIKFATALQVSRKRLEQ